MSKNKVGVKAVPKLNKLIRSSQILTFLDLRSTNLTDAGTVLLGQGLVGNKTLLHLNLSKNDITQTGLESFAPALQGTNLTELDLSLNPLGNNGIKCLADNFTENFTNERRSLLGRGAECKLVKLNLSETKFSEHGGYYLMKSLQDYKNMQCLILDYNHFGSENMHQLYRLIHSTRLETLSINYCKLGETGGISIGDALCHSNHIKEIRAKRNEFRDKTAKAFAQAFEENCVVEKVDLSNNLINDSGGELIGLSLAVNVNLNHLNLRKNNLRFTSGAMFAQSMKENRTIKCIKLQKNSINLSFLE